MTTPLARDRGRAKTDILQQPEVSATSAPDCPLPDLGAIERVLGPHELALIATAHRRGCPVRGDSGLVAPEADREWLASLPVLPIDPRRRTVSANAQPADGSAAIPSRSVPGLGDGAVTRRQPLQPTPPAPPIRPEAFAFSPWRHWNVAARRVRLLDGSYRFLGAFDTAQAARRALREACREGKR
jgi:hypothetical protein